MTFVILPDRASGSRTIGGKAAALAALDEAGLPIPSWFVLSSEAFSASLSPEQREVLSQVSATGNTAEIERVFTSLVLPVELCAELGKAIAQLLPAGGYLAVRSSALDEDGAEHSFAGQLDSYLFVEAAEVCERIRGVWQSAFSSRLIAYRREQGLEAISGPPAVLVQVMIESDCAGVAFSADPVSGRRGVALVSAVPGIGTALVSGECAADVYHIRRTGEVISRSIAHKVVAHRRGTGDGEGVQLVALPAVLADQAVLSAEQAQEIAGLARRCEAHFGRPQDIEWAMSAGRLWLLQSRPITSLSGMLDPDGDSILWDYSNIQESYSGVTTPLTFSFARKAYEEVYRQLGRILGIPPSIIARHSETFRHLLGLIDGRVYYNILNWYRLLALLPGFSANRRFMEEMMGMKASLPPEVAQEIKQATWKNSLGDSARLLITLFTLLGRFCRLPHDIRRFYRRVDGTLCLKTAELGQMRPDELTRYYRKLEQELLGSWEAPLLNDLFAMVFYGLARRLAKHWCGDAAETLQNDLLSGEGGIRSTEPAAWTSKLAALAMKDNQFVELLCNGSLKEIRRAVSLQPAFQAEYEAYLAKFADRCLEELKLESATLRDDPLPLLRSTGNLARRFSAGSVLCRESGSQAGQLRQAAEQQVKIALAAHPLRRWIVGWILQNARQRVRDRENLRFERTRVFGEVRRIFIELGRRFWALGLLTNPRDIFYLEVEECLGYISGTTTTQNLSGLATLRKAEFEGFRNLACSPARRFETKGIVHYGNTFQELRSGPVAAGSGEGRHGLGCCPGQVRGRVRVVLDPKTADVQPGEILVARRTDPGWILLFPLAAGVLVEEGSLLSHSAIVARELGIPTIVSISGLTSWLKDGDLVIMDGGTGLVKKQVAPGEHLQEVA